MTLPSTSGRPRIVEEVNPPVSTTVSLGSRYATELADLALPWQAAEVPEPELLVLNDALAADLGLDPGWLRTSEGIGLLTGTVVPPGATPVAQAYAGHQFGGYSPRLGDGRALLLGELIDVGGRRRDLHLKGSGRTPFARGGDGKAAVGPMLREYVIGEAMHALGIPTTRALAGAGWQVIATGRRADRLAALAAEWGDLVHTAAFDVRDEAARDAALDELPGELAAEASVGAGDERDGSVDLHGMSFRSGMYGDGRT